jgi:dienelactone hydrolase
MSIRDVIFIVVIHCHITATLHGDQQAKPSNSEKQPDFIALAKSGTVHFKPTRAERTVPKHFRLEAHSFKFRTQFVRFSGPVRVSNVTFPSKIKTDVVENNTVHGMYFQPKGKGPFPAVVVLHILGGEFPLSQMIANSLARNQIAALFIKMPYYGERRSKTSRRRMISRNIHETVEGMTQAVFDIRRAAAWLQSRPEVNAEQLGITGISLGGIMSGLSAAAEPRFKKVAIYLGGGQLGQSLWDNPHQDVVKFRNEWIGNGGTRASFIKTLDPVDPVTHGHLLKNRKVLMVAAKNDEVISRESTIALWKSIGEKPELVWLDAGHITAAQYIFGEVIRIVAFFKPSDPELKQKLN